MKHRASVCAVLLATSLLPSTAEANGRFPSALQLAPRPGHPETMAMRTTFGVLLSNDGGDRWDWICESGMGYGARSDYILAVTGKGTMMVAAFEGLTLSRDGGCDWSFVEGPLENEVVVDITTFGADSSSVLAMTAQGQIAVSVDDGVTFAPYGAIDAAAVPITIDVAPSDASRVYVSALRRTGDTIGAALFVSENSGASFAEHAIPLLAGESAAFIAAVDPHDANRVYLRTGSNDGTGESRLLVTDNAGASFATPYTGEQILGFALGDDGKTVFVGGLLKGLLSASTSDFAFAPRTSATIQCLATNASGLWAGSNELNEGFFIGTSVDAGAHFKERLRKRALRGPLACPASSSVARCGAEWPSMQMALEIMPAEGEDAGPIPSLDGGAPAKSPAQPTDSEGCSTSPSAHGSLSLGALLAMMLLRRAKRRRQAEGSSAASSVQKAWTSSMDPRRRAGGRLERRSLP
jgi:hypothetical protein